VVGVRLDLEAPSIIGSTLVTGPGGPMTSALLQERERNSGRREESDRASRQMKTRRSTRVKEEEERQSRKGRREI